MVSSLPSIAEKPAPINEKSCLATDASNIETPLMVVVSCDSVSWRAEAIASDGRAGGAVVVASSSIPSSVLSVTTDCSGGGGGWFWFVIDRNNGEVKLRINSQKTFLDFGKMNQRVGFLAFEKGKTQPLFGLLSSILERYQVLYQVPCNWQATTWARVHNNNNKDNGHRFRQRGAVDPAAAAVAAARVG
jgi:hypothetical protein